MSRLIHPLKQMWQKLARLMSRYPAEAGVSTQALAGIHRLSSTHTAERVLAFQSVPDKFYFLLFGAICLRLGAQGQLIVVRSINGAVGDNLAATFKRTALMAWLAAGPWVRAYGSWVQGVAYRCATWAHPFTGVTDWFRAKTLWEAFKSAPHTRPCQLNIDGIEVGDLIASAYLRYKPSPALIRTDRFVRQLIWQACRDIRQAKRYFSTVRPLAYLTSYTTYLEHGIPTRVALSCGIPVWSFGNLSQFGKRLSLNDVYQTVNSTHYRTDFEALDHQEDRLHQAREQLEKRLSGGIDAATSYMRQSAYGHSDEPLPEGLDGAVVIFLHDFYDSPHVFPALVFDDFWQWVCFTIDTLNKIGVKFFIKPHPNQIPLSDEALGQLRRQYPDLNWVAAKVTNVQLAQAGIACGLTVYGTVAHELAYLGVPTICCAQHPHHAFQFSRTASNREAYAEMLNTYAHRSIPVDEMQRQALMFYYMHNLSGDADRMALRQAFVDFWRVCNDPNSAEVSVKTTFDALIHQPGFDHFVQTLSQGASPSTEPTMHQKEEA